MKNVPLPSGLCGDWKSTEKFSPQSLFQGRDVACYSKQDWEAGLCHLQDVVTNWGQREWLFLLPTWNWSKIGYGQDVLLLLSHPVPQLLAAARRPLKKKKKQELTLG